mgnify:CR=1 FL=1
MDIIYCLYVIPYIGRNFEKEWEKKFYWNRTTLIINDKGSIRFIYENVSPEGHEKEVLSKLHKLQEENY